VHLSFELAVVAPRQVTISQASRVLSSWRVSRVLAVSALRIPLPPGETRLTFSTDRANDPLDHGGRPRPVAFRVSKLGVGVEPEAGERP
jgi:hypothetical protein